MKRVLLMTVAGILAASSAMAGMENARFALHAKPAFVPTKTIGSTCDNAGTITEEANYSPNFTNTPCTQYTTNMPAASAGGAPSDYSEVYLVVGRAGDEGIAGVSFGVQYAIPVDTAFNKWFGCHNGNEYPNGPPGLPEFPANNGGTRITWTLPDGCQRETISPAGVHSVVGYFHLYRYEGQVISITPNNNLSSGIPELAITNCGGATTELTLLWPPQVLDQILGKVGFGAAQGYNPCLVVPTIPSTWGKIKAQYMQ